MESDRPSALGPRISGSGVVGTLDRTEEQVRGRLARNRVLRRIFLLDRDWMTRITMLMVLAGFAWAIAGGTDALNVRLQEFAYATSGALPLTNQEYYASVTQHGVRMLFGFVQQITMAVIGYLLVQHYRVEPRAKWLLYGAVGVFNLSLLLMNGPFFFAPYFNDNYLAATGWYFLSPIGLPGYSVYQVSPLWFFGWVLLAVGTFAWSAWTLLHIRTALRKWRHLPWPERLPVWAAMAVMTTVFFVVTYLGVFVSSLQELLYLAHPAPFNVLENQVLFWQFGHAFVYAIFFIGIIALYWLVPKIADRPLYSWKLGILAVVLYFVFSTLLAIHHLFLTPLPIVTILLTSAASYGVIMPSAITFFTYWMTAKGATAFPRNAVTYFVLLAMAGAVGAGLEGGSLGTISYDVVVHNTLYVVSHFHAMILLFIVPAMFAALYVAFPVLTGRRWWSSRLQTVHFVLSAVGFVGFTVALEELGLVGLLRRMEFFPRIPPIVLGEEAATVFALVLGVGQVALFVNAGMTLLRGEPLRGTYRDFDELASELVRTGGARPRAEPTPPGRPSPPPAAGFDRLHHRKERWEYGWVATVAIAIVVVFALSFPASLAVPTGIQNGDAPVPGTEFVDMVGHQYYWSVNESGPVRAAFANLVVATAGEPLSFNFTSVSVTEALYIPFRTQGVVNVQVLPGYVTHAAFDAPSTPGVYPMPEAEYNGPWFPFDMAVLLVLPAGGAWTTTGLSGYASAASALDLFAPPVWIVTDGSVELTCDPAGLWEDSLPGPTLVANSGPFILDYRVPLASIGVSNYLVNTTSEDPAVEQQWVVGHGMHLPVTLGIYAVGSSGLTDVVSGPLLVGNETALSATLGPGAYLYGQAAPVAYSYDPSGESGPISGSQSGAIMGLWGVLLVA
jgi:terminal oxidase heme-binding subunit I